MITSDDEKNQIKRCIHICMCIHIPLYNIRDVLRDRQWAWEKFRKKFAPRIIASSGQTAELCTHFFLRCFWWEKRAYAWEEGKSLLRPDSTQLAESSPSQLVVFWKLRQNATPYRKHLQDFNPHFCIRRFVVLPLVEPRNQIIIKLHNYTNSYTEIDELVQLYNYCKMTNWIEKNNFILQINKVFSHLKSFQHPQSPNPLQFPYG